MYIVGNGRIITRDEDNPYYENGAIVWDSKIITDIGTSTEILAKYPEAQFIDAKESLIMPGLINMHHHIYSAFARGIALKNYNPQNFMDILEGMWWKIDRKLSLEDCYYSALAVYIDCIKNGVTTMFDHHASFGAIEGSLDMLSNAAQEIGVRSCLCYEVSDRDGKEKSLASIQENERFIKKLANRNDDMQKAMMGLHASFTVEDNTLEKCVQIAKDNNVGLHVHTAEDKADVDHSQKNYKKRVIERFYNMDVLGEKTLAVHCIHVDDLEIELLNETNTMVAHNPQSNMGNAVGTPNIIKIYNAGVLSGLGTDGYTSDILQSYKEANQLCKHQNKAPNVGWTEVPTMLFENNAKMANRYFETPLGKLKKGFAADIIVSDYNPLTPLNEDNANGHILFGIDGRSVITTIINGKIVMHNRELTAINENEVLEKSRELAQKLWNRL